MCGIAGFFSIEKDYLEKKNHYLGILSEMGRVLVPRGPDSRGVFLRRHAGLAHTRLSIIDLQDGTQPMTRRVDGYDYSIVYNGE